MLRSHSFCLGRAPTVSAFGVFHSSFCSVLFYRTANYRLDHPNHHSSSALSGNVGIGLASTTHPPSHRADVSHGLFHSQVPILNSLRTPSLGTVRMGRSNMNGCVVHRIRSAPLGLQAWMSCCFRASVRRADPAFTFWCEMDTLDGARVDTSGDGLPIGAAVYSDLP